MTEKHKGYRPDNTLRAARFAARVRFTGRSSLTVGDSAQFFVSNGEELAQMISDFNAVYEKCRERRTPK